MMAIGSKVLMRSAEVYGEDVGEPGKFELWLAEKSKKSVMDIAIYIGVILGVLFAVGLFVALPLGVVSLLEFIPGFGGIHYVWRNLIVSGMRRIAARNRILTPVSSKIRGMTAWTCSSIDTAPSRFTRVVSEISVYSIPWF